AHGSHMLARARCRRERRGSIASRAIGARSGASTRPGKSLPAWSTGRECNVCRWFFLHHRRDGRRGHHCRRLPRSLLLRSLLGRLLRSLLGGGLPGSLLRSLLGGGLLLRGGLLGRALLRSGLLGRPLLRSRLLGRLLL